MCTSLQGPQTKSLLCGHLTSTSFLARRLANKWYHQNVFGWSTLLVWHELTEGCKLRILLLEKNRTKDPIWLAHPYYLPYKLLFSCIFFFLQSRKRWKMTKFTIAVKMEQDVLLGLPLIPIHLRQSWTEQQFLIWTVPAAAVRLLWFKSKNKSSAIWQGRRGTISFILTHSHCRYPFSFDIELILIDFTLLLSVCTTRISTLFLDRSNSFQFLFCFSFFFGTEQTSLLLTKYLEWYNQSTKTLLCFVYRNRIRSTATITTTKIRETKKEKISMTIFD